MQLIRQLDNEKEMSLKRSKDQINAFDVTCTRDVRIEGRYNSQVSQKKNRGMVNENTKKFLGSFAACFVPAQENLKYF